MQTINVRLGYWRKHPDLHGYIVQSFADGKDDCQKIELDHDDLQKIIAAVKEKRLPHTTGFFFGASDNDASQRKTDVEILERALAWLREGDDSPVRLGVPTAVGPMTATQVILTESAKNDTSQRVTRSVIYKPHGERDDKRQVTETR